MRVVSQEIAVADQRVLRHHALRAVRQRLTGHAALVDLLHARGGRRLVVVQTANALVDRLTFERLQNAEHVQRKLAELRLIAYVAHDQDLVQLQRIHGQFLGRRRVERIEAVRDHDGRLIDVGHGYQRFGVQKRAYLVQHQRPLDVIFGFIDLW